MMGGQTWMTPNYPLSAYNTPSKMEKENPAPSPPLHREYLLVAQ
jgi:hypothetical protein